MIREAKPSDLKAIVDLAVESVSQNPLPVNIDKESMAETAREAISGASHFVWVSEVDGEVVGCVTAMCEKSFWYERQSCSVLLYYTRVPGEGLQLIRKLAEWVKSRPTIKIAVMELEPETDPRLVKYLHRIGFLRSSINCSYVRGLT